MRRCWPVVYVRGREVHLASLDRSDSVSVLGEHRDTLTAVAFAPDGRILGSVCVDAQARVWDASTGTELAVLDATVMALFRSRFLPTVVAWQPAVWG